MTAPLLATEYAFQYPYAGELRDFFRCYESNAGFSSTFGAMLAALMRCSIGNGPPAGWDPYADAIDRTSRGTAVYRTLQRMAAEPHHVTVLVRLYGGRADDDGYREFGDLAPLVSLTRAAEEIRETLVLVESEPRAERTGARVADARREHRDTVCRDFWHEAGERAAAIEQHGRLVDRLAALQSRANAGEELGAGSLRALASGDMRLRDIACRIKASDELLGMLLKAYRYDGEARARAGAIAGADREVSAEDAVRAILARKKGDPDRVVFAVEARREAEAMRKAAHAAYKLARRAA